MVSLLHIKRKAKDYLQTRAVKRIVKELFIPLPPKSGEVCGISSLLIWPKVHTSSQY
jgi:hypothetical protein